MDKNFLQDITPSAQKRSIRNVPIPNHRKKRGPAYIEETPEVYEEPEEVIEKDETTDDDSNYGYSYENEKDATKTYFGDEPAYSYPEENLADNYKKKNPSNHKLIKVSIFVLALVLVVLIVLFSTIFSKGEILITTGSAEASVNSTISLVEKESQAELSENSIEYTLLEITKELTASVPASGTETVSEKASGTITIYNNHSDEPYDLVKNTRFQSTDGKIYRIDKAMEVPGRNGQNPGSIDALIYADEAGEDYNKFSATDFTLPGLVGLPQFENIYAKTKTNITGGFSGEQAKITEEDKTTALTKLEQDLTAQLIASIEEELPENFIATYNPGMFTFTSSQLRSDNATEATIKVIGVLKAYVVSNVVLSQQLASDVLSDDTEINGILITNSESLNIVLNENDTITIEGVAKFGWPIDTEEVKNLIAGTKESDVNETLGSIKGISTIESSIKPFWKSKFPADKEKLNVTIKN